MKSKFDKLITAQTLVLVDFYAEWCNPCKLMIPILSEIKEVLGNTVKIIKIDVDKNQLLATKYNVRGVPTLVLYKNGQQVWRQSGVLQKNEIISIIKSFQ